MALAVSTLAIGCILGAIGTEVLLRAFWPAKDRYYLWPPGLTVVFRPQPEVVPGVGPEARIHANSQGALGSEPAAAGNRAYRILTIGGSTTQCIMLDQSKTWPSLVEEGLRRTADGRAVWVGNLGRAGFSARDHVAAMRLVVPQYRPDAVVMLAGANDMIERLVQGSLYNPRFVDSEPGLTDWAVSRFAMVPLSYATPNEALYTRTAAWRLAKWVKSLYVSGNRLRMDNEGQWLAEARRYRRSAPRTDRLPELQAALDEYGRALSLIAAEARRQSIRLVLLTQPTIWKQSVSAEEDRLLWMGLGPGPSRQKLEWPWWKNGGAVIYNAGALETAMAAYNQRLLDTCSAENVECFDIASRMPRTLEQYFDDMHYTESGARRFADELIAYLKPAAPFSTASRAGERTAARLTHPPATR